jgi:hypothetical protein
MHAKGASESAIIHLNDQMRGSEIHYGDFRGKVRRQHARQLVLNELQLFGFVQNSCEMIARIVKNISKFDRV